MKDGSKGKINDLFVGLKSKMHCIKENDVDGKEKKQENELIKMLLKTRNTNNVLMFCVIKKWPDIIWKDDERYILVDGINTLTCFHKDTTGQ